MSETIFQEIEFLGNSILTGVFLLVIYDGLRILRRAIPHRKGVVNAEDFLYWLAVTFFVFSLLYRENDGGIRWFAVFGIFCGMLLYSLTISSLVVRFFSFLLGHMVKWLGRVLGVCGKPLGYLKKRLKMLWKTIRMVVRKK